MGFYGGAYAQPLQRQTILGSGVDQPQMEGGYAAPYSPGAIGQPTAHPSRFQSILGSLGQWNQNAGSSPGRANNLTTIGTGVRGLFTL